MPTSGLGESADAIRERIGADARYSSFAPPPVRNAPQPARRRLGRVLWTASLVLLLIVLVLVVLVAWDV